MEAETVACRVCQSVSEENLIVSPCFCKGSLGYVHYRCLERWLNASKRDYCELCSYQFKVIRTNKYNFMQALLIWTMHPTMRAYVITDIVIAVMLTVFTLPISIIISLNIRNSSEHAQSAGIHDVWVKVFLSVLLALLLTSYVVSIGIIARDNFRSLYAWWSRCVDVKLILDVHKYKIQSYVPAKENIPDTLEVYLEGNATIPQIQTITNNK